MEWSQYITCSLLQCLARYWQVLSESFLQLRKLSRSMLLQCCANVANAESPTAYRIKNHKKKLMIHRNIWKKCRNLTSLESHDLMARKLPGNRSSWGSLGSRHIFELDFLQLFPPRQPGTKYWNLLWKQKKYICQCYIYSWLLRSKAGGCNKIRSTWNSKRSTFCQLEPSSAKTFQDFDTWRQGLSLPPS